MGHDSSFPVGKSIAVFAIISLAAGILNLIFGHALDFEPLGLLSFGIFCVGYGLLLTSRSNQNCLEEIPISADAVRLPEHRPMIVRDQNTKVRPVEPMGRPVHALTIDLEDYFHTEVASQGISFAQWEKQPSRIEASTQRLLELFDTNRTRATFFVLGWVARQYPSLISEIHKRGHEIGCHSLDHRLVCRMTPAEFYENTLAAKQLIEEITNESVIGYRAPCFSITPGCEWAFDALARLGFAYDSSVHPVDHPLYGNPTAPRTAYPVANGRLMEFPIATWKVAGRNLSVGGGAYLRLLPYQYIDRGLAAWEKTMKTSAMLYLHPWEIDPYQPYIPLSLQSKIRQTWGTAKMEDKLQRLLNQYNFAPVREVHHRVLEGKGQRLPLPAYRSEKSTEQVAG